MNRTALIDRIFSSNLLFWSVCVAIVVPTSLVISWGVKSLCEPQTSQPGADKCRAKGGEPVWNSETHRLICVKRDALIP